MKQVSYEDENGRTITKKEGFSWPTFIILTFLFVFPGIIYAVSKGGFNALRGSYRAGKKFKNK